jgi:DNA repair protein RadC
MNQTKELYVCEVVPTYRKKSKMKAKRLVTNLETYDFITKIFPKKEMNLREVFGAIFLDQSLNTKGYNIITYGGISQSVVCVKQLLQNALICNSSGIIIFHNHPSGNNSPSQADIKVSKEIKKACEAISMRLIDSIIITENGINSINFKEQ